MWNNLVQTFKPTSTPVSLSEAKSWLNVSHTADDVLIEDCLEAATAFLDGPDGIGVALMTQEWDLFMDRFPLCIQIPLTPVQSVDAITYVDKDGATQTLATSVYKVSTNRKPAIVERAYGQSWPTTRLEVDAVKVSFTAGYGTASAIPADIKAAIRWLVAHQYEHRAPIVIGESVNALPFAVQAVIERYAHGRIA